MVALSLLEVLSRCGASVKLTVLLKDIQLTERPWIKDQWPDGKWETLVCTIKQACKAYCESVLTNYEPVLIKEPMLIREPMLIKEPVLIRGLLEGWNTMIRRLWKHMQHVLCNIL